jgi:bromodomain-containing protein 8
MINPLYEEIIAHKNGPLFLAPVREVSIQKCSGLLFRITEHHPSLQSDAPGYSKIVKQPMDLKKIKTKIRKGEISTIDEFQRDLWLIFW